MSQLETYIGILKDSLERKADYLEEILSLSVEQGYLAGNEQFDESAFEKIVDRKDVLIDNINEIDKGFTAVYERIRGDLLADKDNYKAELENLQTLIRGCVELGVQIEVTEERNRASLEMSFSKSYHGVKRAKQSTKVASKYYQSMSNGNVNDSFLYDRKK